MGTGMRPWSLRSSRGYFPDGLASSTVLSFEVNEQNHSNEDQVHVHIGPRRLKLYEEELAGLVISILRVPASGGHSIRVLVRRTSLSSQPSVLTSGLFGGTNGAL